MGGYTDLITEVPAYLDLSGEKFMARLPGIIDRAVRRMATELPIAALHAEINENMTPGSEYVDRPFGAYAMRYFEIDSTDGPKEVISRPHEWVRLYRQGTSQGLPKYYAEFNRTQLIVGPTPDAAYSYRIGYRKAPGLLNSGNEDNEFSQIYYEALLACVCAEGALYAQDSRRQSLIDRYEARYAERRATIIANEKARVVDAANNPPTEAYR